MNSAHAIYCGMHAFLFLEGWKRKTARRKEETQARKAARGDARPLGGREKSDPVRRQEETRVRKAEGRNATPLGVPADLQSAGTPSGLEFLLNA